MGLITYRMVVQEFKRKLRPFIAEYSGFQTLIRRDIALFLEEEHVQFNLCYNFMVAGFEKPAAFERMLKKSRSPLKMEVLKAAKPVELDIAALKEKIKDTFLTCIAEAWEGNKVYRLPNKKTKK
jgi:hypothetical protein